MILQVKILYFTLLASIMSLAGAFTVQYGFGLMPCELCLLQRLPYALVTVLALLGLRFVQFRTVVLVIIICAFLAGGGIASYHAAVEKHWVQGPSGCTNSAPPAGQSLDDFLQKIKHAPIVSCDQPAWEFHGVTMAAMNALWSLLLALLTFTAVQQSRKEKDVRTQIARR